MAKAPRLLVILKDNFDLFSFWNFKLDVQTFLSKEELSLPKRRGAGETDFLLYMGKIFDSYKRLLREVEGEDTFTQHLIENREKSKAICDGVLSALTAYFKGFPHEAYNKIDEVLAYIRDDLDHNLPSFNLLASDTPYSNPIMYRIRTGAGRNFDKGELFHIPFEQRHRVKTQRFSIPGLPCLYLSGSLYTCWEEMGRPDFNTIHMAEFHRVPQRPLRFLNIGLRPQVVAKIIPTYLAASEQPKEDQGHVAILMGLWPLAAACHIKVMHPEGDFKPEYIIPQILLQWCQQIGIDGICYSSTHISYAFSDPFAQMNYVFPAKEMQPSGHCPHLTANFEFTQPLSWQVATAVSIDPVESSRQPSGDFQIEPIPGIRTPYYSTEFYKRQFQLSWLPRCPLADTSESR